jgi:hypothetical protein
MKDPKTARKSNQENFLIEKLLVLKEIVVSLQCTYCWIGEKEMPLRSNVGNKVQLSKRLFFECWT